MIIALASVQWPKWPAYDTGPIFQISSLYFSTACIYAFPYCIHTLFSRTSLVLYNRVTEVINWLEFSCKEVGRAARMAVIFKLQTKVKLSKISSKNMRSIITSEKIWTMFIIKNLGTLVHVDDFFFFVKMVFFIKVCPIISSTGRVGLMFHFRIHPLPLDLQPGAWHHAGLLKEGDDFHYLTAVDHQATAKSTAKFTIAPKQKLTATS